MMAVRMIFPFLCCKVLNLIPLQPLVIPFPICEAHRLRNTYDLSLLTLQGPTFDFASTITKLYPSDLLL
jgi:hypothetical protein